MSSRAALTPASRKRAYAAVWIAAKQLGWTKANVYDMARVWCDIDRAPTSLKELSDAQMHRLLDGLRQAGFGRRAGEAVVRTTEDGELAEAAQVAIVKRLWVRLHRAGGVADPSERALCRWVARQLGADRRMVVLLGALSPGELHRLTSALRSWLRRTACETDGD